LGYRKNNNIHNTNNTIFNSKNIYNTNNNIFYIKTLNYYKNNNIVTQIIIYLIWICWIIRKIIILRTQIIIFWYEYFEL